MKFYFTESLGEKRHVTPEGFLVCADVPIARTGTMDYGPGETPVTVGPEGFVQIQRSPEEVFRPETVASVAGKPVIDGHPEDGTFVTTDNWKRFTGGAVLNPRRGTGDDDDLLLADLVIYDPALIKAINDGKREVSAGYEAEYNEIKPGLGVQYDIVMNHVALVDRGRCGQRCAIGDHQQKGANMARTIDKRRKGSVYDRIRDAFKAKDEESLEEALEEAEEKDDKKKTGDEAEEGTHVHLHVPGGAEGSDHATRDDEFDGRIAKLEAGHQEILGKLDQLLGAGSTGDDENEEAEKKKKEAEEKAKAADEEEMEAEAPAESKDRARKAKDSAYFADSYQDTVALAEILAPGIRIPAFDAAAAPRKTLDALCALRRKALDLAWHQPDTRSMIEDAYGREPDLKKLTCDQTRTLFRAVGALKKAANNATADRKVLPTTVGNGVATTARTLADINKGNASFWSKQSNHI